MPAKHSEIVKLMAGKLGYKHETPTLSKACEYERLLKLKMMGKASASDSAIAVICLDLAVSMFGLPFDSDLALKLAAVKKTAYKNIKHTIEKLLNIEDVVTINSMCVLLGCTSAATMADSILAHFKDSDVMDSDLSHPQFVCMAVYQACRLEKIKISKNKFITNSHLKASQWNELETEWTKMVQSIKTELTSDRQTSKSSKSKNIAQQIDSRVSEMTEGSSHNNETNLNQQMVEDYEVWKDRVLKQAYKEMEALKSKNADATESIKVISAIDNMHGPPRINRHQGVRLIFH